MSSAEIPQFDIIPPENFEVPNTNIHARLFQDGDAENLARLANNEAVKKYVPWARNVSDLVSATNKITEFENAWNNRIMARYALEDTDQFIGYAGLWSDQVPGFYEFGFAILPEFQGNGVGTNSVLGLMNMARTSLSAKGMVAYVDDTNDASKTVVKRLLFQPTDQFDQGDRRYELHF